MLQGTCVAKAWKPAGGQARGVASCLDGQEEVNTVSCAHDVGGQFRDSGVAQKLHTRREEAGQAASPASSTVSGFSTGFAIRETLGYP
jgi:hypothetical protein